ncbi:MAG: PIN domain-containing protein [Methanosarcinales archaeon Met12]|nr:MAG: PIN domain-containing protein [Methanosarcinales archaeon Met12]
MKHFIDTWGWIVLGNKRESRHTELYSSWKKQKSMSYTTDYVLDETFTLLFRQLSFKEAKRQLDVIDLAIKEGYLRLERITAERFEKAKILRIKFQDKPRVSFTDLTSMVVMAEIGITNILTQDDHFAQVGMGFQKIPQA